MTVTETYPGTTAGTPRSSSTYHDALAGLRIATSGEERALLLESMAADADRAAAVARGVIPADSPDSSLAWTMTAVLLRQLAAAQRGFVLKPAEDLFSDHWDAGREWEDVARALTSREFTAAYAVLHAELVGELGRGDQAERAAAVDFDPGDPATPALARLSHAAHALGEADW